MRLILIPFLRIPNISGIKNVCSRRTVLGISRLLGHNSVWDAKRCFFWVSFLETEDVSYYEAKGKDKGCTEPGLELSCPEKREGGGLVAVGVSFPKREVRKKRKLWVRHRDFPGGHPSQYYSGPWALSCGVLMGSGVVAQV